MITAFYAGILALMNIVLILRVALLRLKHQVSTGDGGNEVLERRIRVHGNFIENAALAVVLLFIIETAFDAPLWVVHALGGLFLLSRVFHAVGLNMGAGVGVLRKAGTVFMLLFYAISGLALIAHSISSGAFSVFLAP